MTTEPVKVDTQRPPPLERKTYWCIHCGELYQRLGDSDAPAVCEKCRHLKETEGKR